MFRELPVRTVDRTRLAAAGIGSLAMLLQLGQVGNALRSPGFIRLSTISVLLLVVLMMDMLRRKSSSWWTVPVVPALVAVGAAGLKDPLGGTSLALSTLIVCSLYDTNRRWFARMAGALVAMPVAVAISPDVVAQATSWHTPSVLGLLPQILLMGVLTRAFYLGLLRQERAAARDATLTQAGHELLAVTENAEIRRIGERTAEELVRTHPGVALLIVSRDRPGLTISFGAGTPEGVSGRLLTGSTPDPAELSALIPGFGNWQVDPLGGEPATAPLLMVVGGRRAVPDEVRDAFRSLSYQVILAEEAQLARAELEYRAHHDHLTGLPTRAKFLRAAASAIDGGGPVTLLNIDLDGFKRVNDQHGHAAGDELLVAVAERISAAAGRDGIAARFGGDEFALLLTGPTGIDQAERLCAELCEPVRLSAATVRVGASVGVAPAEPGVTVADLLRRADQAMYSAKAGGKNRVVRYGVTETVAV
ncbi:diguanylate cyclase domain-containing protein [Actinoplanes sp. HUAS TT8]|uniref:diguanylate cyclase domain-containing protein n=1 Tax=Actinoplanes sp. HUAS TT8 TaxID=3447453 RepID=UPI003F51BA3D